MKNLSVCLLCKDALFFRNDQIFPQKNNKKFFSAKSKNNNILITNILTNVKTIIF